MKNGKKPFLVAFGENERITIGMKDDFLERIPNPTVITLKELVILFRKK